MMLHVFYLKSYGSKIGTTKGRLVDTHLYPNCVFFEPSAFFTNQSISKFKRRTGQCTKEGSSWSWHDTRSTLHTGQWQHGLGCEMFPTF